MKKAYKVFNKRNGRLFSWGNTPFKSQLKTNIFPIGCVEYFPHEIQTCQHGKYFICDNIEALQSLTNKVSIQDGYHEIREVFVDEVQSTKNVFPHGVLFSINHWSQVDSAFVNPPNFGDTSVSGKEGYSVAKTIYIGKVVDFDGN